LKVIEFGGGEKPLYHPNVDVRKLPNVDIIADFEQPLPLPDAEYDLVYSKFLIEHIPRRKVKQFIKEIYRILKPNGKAEITTANLLEQCKIVANSEEWDENFSCMLFGDQDYPENTHKVGFSPKYAVKLFTEAGFSKIEIKTHPNCATDMIIEAQKKEEPKIVSEQEKYDREYFEDGTKGYTLYRDFPVHYRMLKVILERTPESVLDVGGARGYIVKKLEAEGIRAVCMDVSEYCWHTHATDSFVLHDATKAPWPFKDKEFDLCISFSFMEHLAENEIDTVITEMARVSKRSMHTITPEKTPYDIDVTHKTFKPWDWWLEKFKTLVPEYPTEILTTKEEEYGSVTVPKPDGLIKLNVGCFQNMYHYGWENIDILDMSTFARQNGYIFRQADVKNSVPKPDGSVDIVFASHFLEHLSRGEGSKFLSECLRVLKPDGLIRLAIPDSKLLAKKYSNGNISDYKYVNIGVENAQDDAEAFYHLLLAEHQTIYDYASMKKLLEKAGFQKVKKMEPFKSQSKTIEKQTIPAYPTLSTYVESQKPSAKEGKQTPLYKQYLYEKIAEGKTALS